MKYPSHAELTELTPEEGLRLIEDVWETLATDPDALPVSDDHKREIDPRLDVARGQGASRREEMTWQLRVQARAEDDISRAFEWYESQRTGIGTELLTDLDACFSRIARALPPFLYVALRPR